MRFANVGGRLQIATDDRLVDVETASQGRFPADPMAAYERWDALLEWSHGATLDGGVAREGATLLAPSPRPRQSFGIGLNYRLHVAEGKVGVIPEHPATFTKFPSCINGPTGEIPIWGDTVDWEVEMVVVIGRTASRVGVDKGWDHVAGLMIGQDISERTTQQRPPSQWSLGKSFPGFGPVGPALVSLDELDDRDDLGIGCSVNGVEMQSSRTKELIFPVPELVSRLSHNVTLFAGDVIFTGTPNGVGAARTPPVFLKPGDVVTSWIEGLGELRNTCVAPDA
jgi:2-keto-4-pentenoate hydratase/2-oxohepta-3-ene-1,7-dioic acid hydratase in catechol pathway